MASLSEIRTALKATIETAVSGLTGYETVPEAVNVPAFLVVPRATEYSKTFARGFDSYTFDVIVLVSRSDDRLAQLALDPYITGSGDASVRQAIWNNRSLGIGTDADTVEATVTAMAEYGATYTFGNTEYAGARLSVTVLTSGT